VPVIKLAIIHDTQQQEVDMATATVFIGLGSRNERFIFGSAAVIYAGAGTDYVEIDGTLAGILYGQGGVDILIGADHSDTGSDLIYGDSADDVMPGGGADLIRSRAGDDIVFGGAGGDFVFAGADQDFVDGGSGDDVIWGGTGSDVLHGGAGEDVLHGATPATAPSLPAITVEWNGLNDTSIPAETRSVDATPLELTPHDTAADTLVGGDGNDQLFGADGDDILEGNALHDFLNGGLGNDRMDGGAGHDRYVVDSTLDRIIENPGGGGDTVDAFITYSLMVDADLEHLNLLGKANLNGTGNEGPNSINGNEGSNTLHGRGGGDVLAGGEGNDILIGGGGTDFLNGGPGADRFRYFWTSDAPAGSTRENIRFDRSEGDRLDLSGIDADSDGTPGNQAFRFISGASFTGVDGQLRLTGLVLQGDVNGDRVADLEIQISGVITRADMIL
jgi:Ca2+-binding RTX toxin-like protein